MILQSLAGLPAFLVYFCTGLVAVLAHLFVYNRRTPHNKFQLIRACSRQSPHDTVKSPRLACLIGPSSARMLGNNP
jgi:hypothetical protein